MVLYNSKIPGDRVSHSSKRNWRTLGVAVMIAGGLGACGTVPAPVPPASTAPASSAPTTPPTPVPCTPGDPVHQAPTPPIKEKHPIPDQSGKVQSLQKQLHERDKRIEELQSQLEALKQIDKDSEKQRKSLRPPASLKSIK